jgi:hypothetical protein
LLPPTGPICSTRHCCALGVLSGRFTWIARTPQEISVRAGLEAFVNHSDCDGVHSRGQVYDIVGMFNFVRKPAARLCRLIRRSALPGGRRDRLKELLSDLNALHKFYRVAETAGGYVVFA